MQFPMLAEREESHLVNRPALLQRMREYAQTVSLAVTRPRDADESAVQQALNLVDLAGGDSVLARTRKMSLGVPPLLAGMQSEPYLEQNLTRLRAEAVARMPEDRQPHPFSVATEDNFSRRDELRKLKRAEKKLRNLLDTYEC